MQPLKFRNEYVMSSHTLLGMWLLIHVSKRGYGSAAIKTMEMMIQSSDTCMR